MTVYVHKINTHALTIHHPAVPPDLPSPPGLQVSHPHHSLDESREKCFLIAAETLDRLPRLLVVRIQRLVRVQKPPQPNQVLEVLVVEHDRSGVEPAGHVPIPALWTQGVELPSEFRVHVRVGPPRTRLVVEAEDDGEAPPLADGVRAGERDQVGDGEVELRKEVDKRRRVRSRARHDPVRVLLASRQAVHPAELHVPVRSSTLPAK